MNRPASPIRVVFLLEDLKFGGTQHQTLELAARLDKSKFDAELWMMAGGNDFQSLAESSGLPLHRLSGKNRVGPDSVLRLGRELLKKDIDLLVLLTVIPNIWGRIWGKLAGIPAIVGTCRGGASPRRQYERLLWPLADHVICNTEDLRELLTLRCRVPRPRVSAIPNGIDSAFLEAPQGNRPSGPVILSVARLVPDKDHETLIAAFGRIAADFPEAELRLVGDGPLRRHLLRLAEETGFPGRIHFLGSRTDVRNLMYRSTVFVLSSIHEALSNAVIEAMACGLPIVATRVGGLPEVVHHEWNGLLVPPKDPAALAAALARLLSREEERREFGRAGRRLAEEEYSMDTMVKRHEELFLRILDSRLREIANGSRSSEKVSRIRRWS